jgi:signal transduction histidine kinase
MRVQRVILGAAGVALLLFAVPLAIAVGVLVHSDAVTDLQRDATRAVAAVGDGPVQPGQPLTIPTSGDSARIAVYATDGALGWGRGPDRSGLAARAADADTHDGREAGEVAVVVPVITNGQVVGSVRAALPVQGLILHIVGWWAALVALAAAAMIAVRILAHRLAGGVAAPVEQLTVAARALGDGAFDLALPRSGVRETDEAGAALLDTARRIGAVVRRERAFTRDVSHQLRTPLSGLLTGLETAAADPAAHSEAVDTALDRARQLQTIVDDLILVRGSALDAHCDVAAEARDAVARLRPPESRRVQLRCDDVPPARCAPAVVRQVLNVLLDNAVRHGAGEITVTVEALGDSVVVEVADEGPGFAADAAPGTGLRLAGDLAESVYGALLIRRRGPRPRVAVLVPAVPLRESDADQHHDTAQDQIRP